MATLAQFTPIGFVRNAIETAHRETPWESIESEIVIDERWRDALKGLDQFSHIWIIFYIDRVPAPSALQIHPMKKPDLPLVGIFATRSPQRPNPIGIRAAELLSVRENVLRVRGLDALNGTPVLDLKPYIPRGDAIGDARVGEWVYRYWRDDSSNAK
jgi:tRNA-Thr(GGU) m(6)t(6)A37 methyltransferase TsaA